MARGGLPRAARVWAAGCCWLLLLSAAAAAAAAEGYGLLPRLLFFFCGQSAGRGGCIGGRGGLVASDARAVAWRALRDQDSEQEEAGE